MFEDKLLLAYDLVTTTIVPNDAVGQWSFQQDGFPSLPLPKFKPHRWAVVGIGWHWCSELRHRVQVEAAQLGCFCSNWGDFCTPWKTNIRTYIFPASKRRNIYKTTKYFWFKMSVFGGVMEFCGFDSFWSNWNLLGSVDSKGKGAWKKWCLLNFMMVSSTIFLGDVYRSHIANPKNNRSTIF